MSAVGKLKYRIEPSFDDVVAQHPDFPRLIARKIDVHRRGVNYTKRTLAAMNPEIHQLYTWQGHRFPHSLLLRDGTTLLVMPQSIEKDPYDVDYVDGKFVLVDDGEIVEDVDLWPKPKYYDLKTSSGLLMREVVSARPQRLDLFVTSFCYFYHVDAQGCKFCSLPNVHQKLRAAYHLPTRLNPEDVKECFTEALKEGGRFTNIHITGGTMVKGADVGDLEVDYYISILHVIAETFATQRFPSQLLATSYNERQLRRLREETGLGSFTADIEVLNEEKFNWICPGKACWVGYQEWKNRLIRGVDIFGRGNISTGIVGGVELAGPHGFTSEDDALKSTLDEAESLAEKGVTTVHTIWMPQAGSQFADQKSPSLDYFIRLAQGLQNLRLKYNLSVDFDDYRRCGNHSDSDLARLHYAD
ncbi:MAG: radical SAM protein [Rhizomicrobium sp.]